MIKTISFENFRNLSGIFDFSRQFNVVFGPNNSGKTNLLDGIKLVFNTLTGDYFKLNKTDFNDSDDSKIIRIKVLLDNKIESLSFYTDAGEIQTGFMIEIYKSSSNGRYVKKLKLLNGQGVDFDILREDKDVPGVISLPLVRSEDLYSRGFITDLSLLIEESDEYKAILNEAKSKSLEMINTQVQTFVEFCGKFNQSFGVELTSPNLSDEKAHIVDKHIGEKEHSSCVGSGYRSVATIILNTMLNDFNIVLIDEIENHMHPSLLRLVVNELKKKTKCLFICTTHSPVVVNEVDIRDLIYIDGNHFSDKINPTILNKLNTFMHPGRAEILFAENILLVEGYSEELVLSNYVRNNNLNLKILNVNGIMFEPYICLCSSLGKKAAVLSDTDIRLSESGKDKSQRFINLEEKCKEYGIPIFGMENTFETDVFNCGYINSDMLEQDKKHPSIMIAKAHKKTEIASKMIEEKVDISEWHVIKSIKEIFKF